MYAKHARDSLCDYCHFTHWKKSRVKMVAVMPIRERITPNMVSTSSAFSAAGSGPRSQLSNLEQMS